MKTELEPPIAKKEAHETNVHGISLKDDYFWLRNRESQEIIDYLNQENAYTDSILKPTEDLQKALYDEMLSRIKETDQSVPIKKGDFFYYSKTEKGKQYNIYCRKLKTLEAEEEIILDLNELAKGHDYFDLGVMEISSNHKYLAYSTDVSGSEIYTLQIKDLETGTLLEDKIQNTGSSLEWAEDHQTFFYSTLDEMKRPFKLFKHRLGDDSSNDEEIFHEEDERFFLGIDKTKDKKFLILDLNSKDTSEVHYLEADQPNGIWEVFFAREKGHEYSIEHHEGVFYVLTNDEAINFRVMATPVNSTGKEFWEEFYAHRPEIKIEDFDIFKDYFVIHERIQGNTGIRFIRFEDLKEQVVEMGEDVYTSWLGANPEYDTNHLRFGFSSLLTPASVFDYEFKTGEKILLKQQEVLGGYDSSEYQSEKLFATSHDGIQIPISLVYKKGLKKPAPFFIYGYGSYGISMDPTFSSTRLSLLDRGFVFAIAHIRGGGDLGKPWYESAKLGKKKNTFLDFISCAEYVIEKGYTTAKQLVASGGSAGGLLMGAVVNMRPDLFHSMILDVPFVDALNTMLDETLPLTVTEYDEWGNPSAEKEVFDYIQSYSPYENIKKQDYPNMLVTAGLNDPRVQYWEPAKFVAKLRQYKTDQNLLLLKTHMGAGHGGPSGRYEYLKELARDYAFFISSLGLSGNSSN